MELALSAVYFDSPLPYFLTESEGRTGKYFVRTEWSEVHAF